MSEFNLSLADLAVEHFQPLVGKGFKIVHPDHQEILTLQTVEPGGKWRDSARTGFSLTFRGESTTILLQQGLHPMEAAGLGKLEVFLVPIERNPDGTHLYQVIFS